jgi:hypothetical protein
LDYEYFEEIMYFAFSQNHLNLVLKFKTLRWFILNFLVLSPWFKFQIFKLFLFEPKFMNQNSKTNSGAHFVFLCFRPEVPSLAQLAEAFLVCFTPSQPSRQAAQSNSPAQLASRFAWPNYGPIPAQHRNSPADHSA